MLTKWARQGPEADAAPLLPCAWCGVVHPVAAICLARPASRGMSRRSFCFLAGAAAIGALLPGRVDAYAPTVFTYVLLDFTGREVHRGVLRYAGTEVITITQGRETWRYRTTEPMRWRP